MGDIAKCSQGAENEYYNEKLLYDYLVLMLSYLLTMHGVMNHVQ